MAIHRQSLNESLVRQLYELACTPFCLSAFHDCWKAFGWKYVASDGNEFGFHVQIPDCWPLNVDPLGGDLISARLPFCYWDYHRPSNQDELSDFTREREAFDNEFEIACGVIREVLSPPFEHWTDANEDAHRAMLWEGTYGLIILQQAAFDLQFGIELNIWLQAGSRETWRPTTPLIDWLCRYSQGLHSELGFPQLVW